MSNFRKINDDIFKDWLEFRDKTIYCNLSDENLKHKIYSEDITENI